MTKGFALPCSDDRSIDPAQVVTGMDQRVDEMFRAESGRPLVRAKKREPLGPGRGNYVRHYSYSMMAFAARCLYLDEQVDQANAALTENAQHYLDHPKDINDRDSFHWHSDIALRMIEMFGSRGTVRPGRVTPDTEAVVLQPIWLYSKAISSLDKAEHKQSKTWHVYSSENHHVMDFVTHWNFAKLARDRPEYRDLPFDRGHTAAEHYEAWSDFFVVYCLERARKSLFIEMMSGAYNSDWARPIFNLYDFGEPRVRRAAGLLLDLFLAYWAQEQIDGISGGGKSRVYFGKGLYEDRHLNMGPLAWFYFGIGIPPKVNGHDVNAALSGYRPPAVVADIALDVNGRGRYEVIQRAQGRGEQGKPNAQVTESSQHPSKVRTDGGGIIRYTFCDPAFIIGTPIVEARPLSDWVHISAQNRWQGVIFAGEGDARIVPVARPENNHVALNAQWSVQSKGTLITQKQTESKGAVEMVVWLSIEGLSEPLEDRDTVFVEAAGAYAAVRVAAGGYHWNHGDLTVNSITGTRPIRPGYLLVTNDLYAPVIVEVMAKADVESFDAFRAKVQACKLEFDGPVLGYTSIYGDVLTFDTSQRQTQMVNGEPVDFEPEKVYDSPFLSAIYNSGVVTIRKGEREAVLDFTADLKE